MAAPVPGIAQIAGPLVKKNRGPASAPKDERRIVRVRVLAAAEGQKRLPGACEAFLFFSYILSEFLKKLVAPH